MVDYSKWDKFAADVSDSEEEDDAPKVTELQSGAKVKIGPDGAQIISNSTIPTSKGESSTPLDQKLHVQPENDAVFSENGAVTDKYIWRQNRYEVVVRIPISNDMKPSAINVSIEGRSMRIVHGDTVILEGTLRYDVKVPEDGVDWEVVNTNNIRHLTVTMQKSSPLEGVIVWWSGILEGDEEIDVTKIAGRGSTIVDNWRQAQEMFKERVKERHKIDVE